TGPTYGDGALDDIGGDTGGGLPGQNVVGEMYAAALGIGVGDKIQLTQSNGPRTMMGVVPRSRVFSVSAIYHVGNERYDRYVVFLPIESAKSLFGQDEGYPFVGVRLTDPNSADDFAALLRRDQPYDIQTGIQRNGTYVSGLVVERNVKPLIRFIVVDIRALNIIPGALMLVKNKARDAAILRPVSAPPSGVVRIFIMSGTILGAAR